jgi:bifunctional non-homologous end joining protein LigD
VARKPDEVRDGVDLTNLDQPLFDGAGVSKRQLVDYLDRVAEFLLPELADRPLSVIRVHRGQEAFMQKNVPKYAPEWIRTVAWWSESSRRDVHYALCDDRRTLLWFGNQRAVEYHPALLTASNPEVATHLVLDLDPPEGDGFAAAVATAHLVRRVLDDLGLAGGVKTSGAKGVHVFVPVVDASVPDAAAATRAIASRVAALDPAVATVEFLKEDRGGRVFVDATRAGGATVIAAWSPRLRPGVPVSFPVAWSDLDSVVPTDFTITNVADRLGAAGPWRSVLDDPMPIPPELLEEGHAIPTPRVQAMHEGKRRKRAREAEG